MNINRALCASTLLGCLAGCSGVPDDQNTTSSSASVTAGSSAAGALPAGLPARMMVGLFEDTGSTWMKNSGVRWDARYRYFTKGWVNNWGWGSNDGGWGLSYLRECDAQGFVPAVQYYQIFAEPGGGENQTLAKVQNAGTMRSYFNDFKILMQRVKEYGKPAMILLEADALGFLQQQTGSNPQAYAAVAASGMPELASLPNTVAGFSLAYLQLRKSVGANNAVLGMHISAWAGGKDLGYFNITDPLSPEVDKVYNFLAPLGLAANQTGSTYDVLVGDPLDRDSDYYRLVQGQDRWWDASDSASINSKSFNRYAEWLRVWNQKAKKRWVLWQIPVGNSNHLNVYNNGGARQGYKDNRPEYFLGNGTAHMVKFANVGVISLLFGAGAGGQSGYDNDYYTDGQLFMKSRGAAILNAGGVTLVGSGTEPPPPPPPPPPTGGTYQYNFDSGAQGWVSSGGMITSATSTTARPHAGSGSLAIKVNATGASKSTVYVRLPSTAAGKTVSFRVWFAAGSPVSSVQPYVLQGAAGGWAWTGNWRSAGSLVAGSWNTITVAVPANAATPLEQLGVEIAVSRAWSGTAYVDSVSWQ